MSLGIKSSAFLRVFTIGFLDSWNPCVKDFNFLDLQESIIGFNKFYGQWAGIEVKNKKLMPISEVPDLVTSAIPDIWDPSNREQKQMKFKILVGQREEPSTKLFHKKSTYSEPFREPCREPYREYPQEGGRLDAKRH